MNVVNNVPLHEGVHEAHGMCNYLECQPCESEEPLIPGVEHEPGEIVHLFPTPYKLVAKRYWHGWFGHPEDQRIGLRASHTSGHVRLCECGMDYMVKVS